MTKLFPTLMLAAIAITPATAHSSPTCGGVTARKVRVCEPSGGCRAVPQQRVCVALVAAGGASLPALDVAARERGRDRRELARLIGALR